MVGYVAITSEDWFNNLKLHEMQDAVFWRKRRQFKALKEGEPFFFLSRSRGDGERYFLGSAKYKAFRVMSASDAWSEFGSKLGALDEVSFYRDILNIYKDFNADLGCIILSEVNYCLQPVPLQMTGIAFSNGIVSGKKVDSDDCFRLSSMLEKGVANG